MARRAGRNSRLYINITSAGTAEPLAYIAKLSFKQTTTKIAVTAFGDPQETYVAGLPDFQGSFSGFYDDATAQTYTASLDGQSRKFYLYPDIVDNPAQYWFGTCFPDFSMDLDVGAALAISGNFNAASAVAKVG